MKPTARTFSKFLAIAALGFLVASCGRGSKPSAKKAPGGDDAAVDIFALQEEVQKLLDDAQKAGMAKLAAPQLDRAKSQAEDGDQALEAGKEADARKKYVAARKSLKSFLADVDKRKAALEKVAPLRKDLEAAKKKAEAAKADSNAKDAYQAALQTYKQALEELDKAGTAADVERTSARLQQAKREIEAAIEAAEENARYRKLAERQKKEAETWKAKAQERKADEVAPDSWLAAVQSEADAADWFERGDFRAAADYYKSTAQLFVAALQAVDRKDELAKAEAEAAEREKAYLEGLKAAEGGAGDLDPSRVELEPTEPSVGVKPPPVEAVAPPPGPAEAAPATATIEVFENYDPSAYPQELDAEDEAFLELNYRSLVDSGLIQYDPASNAVRLEYAVGTDFKKDAIVLNPATKVEYESALRLVDTRKLSPEERKKQSPFVFSGNTIGFIAIPVPFRFYVRIEYTMQILVMDRTGTFTAIVMLDRARRDRGYAAQWLNVGVLRDGVPQVGGAPGKYAGPADLWFAKTRPVPMLVEFRMPDPKKGGDPTKSGRLTVTYDAGAAEAISTSAALKNYQAGLVAFQWSRTKFEVRDLLVTGILDKKGAVEILRKKLGKPKAPGSEKPSAPASKKPAPKPKPAPAEEPAGGDEESASGGEEPGAPSGEAPAETKAASPSSAKKAPGGDFDF